MKLPMVQALPKLALGMLLASGVATAAIAASAQPAQAGVVVSVGVGGGYAPGYHWYRCRTDTAGIAAGFRSAGSRP